MRISNLEFLFKSTTFQPEDVRQYITSLLSKFEVALQFDDEHLILPSLLPVKHELGQHKHTDTKVSCHFDFCGYIFWLRFVGCLASVHAQANFCAAPALSTFQWWDYTCFERITPATSFVSDCHQAVNFEQVFKFATTTHHFCILLLLLALRIYKFFSEFAFIY